MADTTTCDNSLNQIKHKKRSRMRNSAQENHDKMVKYYEDPEKQKKLRERIELYNNEIIAMQEKVQKLRQYLHTSEMDAK